eukprot:8395538-Ditylum_brightwellii.AAC.1
MLQAFGECVAVFCLSLGNEAWHGQVHITLDVVPIEVNATKYFALLIHCYLIVLFHGINEMFFMFFSLYFDTKSSTTNSNVTGLHLCLHKPGLYWTG